jgi:ABC-2 type transport system ATP-binding protein
MGAAFRAAEPRDALRLRGLRKSFGKVAVDNLDLTVHAGELYALLGPNGAGKSTTLRIIAGLLPADAGDIQIFGIDARPARAKRITAWLPDEPMLYDQLTPIEHLEFIAGLWQVEPRRAQAKAAELFNVLQLADQQHERCEGFSRGTKQKVALAGALIHEPKLLLLDEPLTGLDAAMARQVKDLLTERVRNGAAIILTTHILEVAERLADRIGIIQHGRLLAQ